MLAAIASGTLSKAPELKKAKSGSEYCQFFLRVPINENNPIVVLGVAFGDAVEKIAKLGAGDALSVTGSLKPTEWKDSKTGVIKHGLTITVNNSLSAYDKP